MVENSSEVIKVVDLDGTLRYASPALRQVFGYDPEETVGTNVLDFVHPDDLPHVLEETEKTLMEGAPTSVAEYRFRHADGSWRHVESAGVYLLDDPAVRGVVVSVRDVTGRKEAERALGESERRYATLLSNVPALVYRCLNEPHWPLEFASDYALELTGYPPGDLLLGGGVKYGDLIVEEDRLRVWEEVQAALDGRRRFKLRYAIRRKDGGLRHVEEYGRGIPGRYGGIEAIEGLIYDVTDVVRAEERLREEELRYRTLGERIPVITYMQEPEGPNRTVYLRPQYEEILGYPNERFVDDPEHWVRVMHPDDRGRVLAEDRRTNETGEPFKTEYRQFARDGSVVWLRDEATLVRDREGRALYWLGVQLDITERKEAEERLKESEERYRRQSRELALLHQVRTALAQEMDLTGVLHEVVEAIADTYGYTQVSAYLLEGDELLLQHQVGYERVIERIPVTEGVSGRAVRTGRPVLVEDVRADPDFLGAIEGIVSEICVPLFDEGESVGFLNVESKDGVRLTLKDLELMVALGEHVSVALSRARLYTRVRRSEKYYRSLIRNASDVITVLDADGNVRYSSPAVERMLGYRPEERAGRSSFELMHPDDLPRAKRALVEALRSRGVARTLTVRVRHREGSWRDVEVTGTNLLGDPSVGGIVLNWRDVTERKRAEEALKKSESRLAEAQRLAQLGGWEWDIETDEVTWSDEVFRIYGFAPGELVPSLGRFMEVVHPDDRPRIGAVIDGALNRHKPYDLEHRIVRPDGEVRWVHRRAEVFRDGSGRATRMVGTVHDVTERRTLEDRLRHQAFHDDLTGLPNRSLFVDRLEQALRRTRRRRRRRVAVLFMDLDGFKVVNDSLGHEAGDRLLVAVADRLRGCLRPEDTLARFGGDEFVVLLEDVGRPEDAVRVAERVLETLSEPFLLRARELFVSVSVGVALGGARPKRSEDLLRDADTAMYEAKSEAASGYRVFDPKMHERVLGRLELENDLRRAVEASEFVVHYQPIVRLEDGELRGMEALARWDHPQRGLLNPDEFVPLAEESGMVVPVGEGALREACLRAKEWQEEHPRTPPLGISVNLSAKQLSRPDLAETVASVLQETGLEGTRLTLDVTETVYVRAFEANAKAITRLTGLGVRISIDDFGTGYSSLSYLKRLPADAIKIDKSFVGGLGEDPGDTAITRMIVELAHTLGMEVIAEGVETWAQAALLREMGCDMAQGFFFARPLPPEAVPEILAQ